MFFSGLTNVIFSQHRYNLLHVIIIFSEIAFQLRESKKMDILREWKKSSHYSLNEKSRVRAVVRVGFICISMNSNGIHLCVRAYPE